MFFTKCAPLSHQTLTYGVPLSVLRLLGDLGALMAPNMAFHKVTGFIFVFLHFWTKMDLSLGRSASDVYCLIAGVANPFAWTAIGPLGTHPDPT